MSREQNQSPEERIAEAERVVAEWHLGKTSSHFETSGRGVSTVSTGRGDLGGISYGAYQLSSNTGTLDEYLRESRFAGEFAGLEKNTPEFIAKWKDVAAREPAFAQEQQDFIRDAHYRPAAANLSEVGIDLSDRGRAVHDALWSSAVQMRGLAVTVFERSLAPKIEAAGGLAGVTDREIVEAVQDYKVARNDSLFASSPKQWPGLIDRAGNEKEALVALADSEALLREHGRLPEWRAEVPSRTSPLADNTLMIGERGDAVHFLQSQLQTLGHTDSRGKTIEPDGDFGRGTRSAVRQAQDGAGLPVTGDANEATRDAIDAAVRERALGPGPIAPDRELDQRPAIDGRGIDRSGQDPMFPGVRDQVRELNRGLGIDSPETADRVAAALVAEWRTDQARGSIDGVVLGQKGTKAEAGEYVFAYSGSSERPSDWVGVKTAEAVQTPVEQSLAQAETLQRQQVMEAQQVAQAQQPSNGAPAISMG